MLCYATLCYAMLMRARRRQFLGTTGQIVGPGTIQNCASICLRGSLRCHQPIVESAPVQLQWHTQQDIVELRPPAVGGTHAMLCDATLRAMLRYAALRYASYASYASYVSYAMLAMLAMLCCAMLR